MSSKNETKEKPISTNKNMNQNDNCNNRLRTRANPDFAFKKFHFLTTNSDVLTADKIRELKTRISAKEPDLMMVQETKPKNFNRVLTKAEYKIPNYDLEWKNMEQGETGRGLITYVRAGINYRMVSFDIPFIEYLAVSIELNSREKLLAVNIYRSPNSDNLNNELLNKLLLKITEENRYDYILLTGDCNYKHINWQLMTCLTSENSKDFYFLEALKDSFMEQHIGEPTRGRGTDTPAILDLVITKNDDVIEDLEIESPLGKSDHAVIQGNLACQFQPKVVKKTRYVYEKADFKKLREMLPKNWESELTNGLSTDEMWCIFKEKLTQAIDECIPKKTITLNGRPRKGKKMDKRTLSKIKRKKRVWDAYIKTGSGQKYLEFCRLRNQVRALTRKVQKALEKKVAKEAKTNPKKFWQFVSNKTKSRPTIPDLLLDDEDEEKDDGNFTTNDQEKADRFNQFFASVFNPKTEEPNQPLPRRTDQILANIKIDNEIVLKAISKLKTGKSPGPA